LLHSRHGQLMRANGRKVNQNCFDGGDLGVHTLDGGVVGLDAVLRARLTPVQHH
jgi:hypothetical protein